MKPLFICILFLVAGPMVSTANVNAAKFTVTYSIRFNEVTLYEAARLEKVIKEEFGDACSFSIKVESVSETTIYFGNGIGATPIWPLDIESETDSEINIKDIPWQYMRLDTLPGGQTLELHW